MSVPESVVRAFSFLITVITLNALLVYDVMVPGTVSFELLMMTLGFLFAFHAGLREFGINIERESSQRERPSDSDKPSIEAVKQRYVEDDDYTIYDMEDDMETLMEESELE